MRISVRSLPPVGSAPQRTTFLGHHCEGKPPVVGGLSPQSIPVYTRSASRDQKQSNEKRNFPMPKNDSSQSQRRIGLPLLTSWRGGAGILTCFPFVPQLHTRPNDGTPELTFRALLGAAMDIALQVL